MKMINKLSKLTELQLAAIIFPVVLLIAVLFYFGVASALYNIVTAIIN